MGCSHCGGFNSTYNEIPHTDEGLRPQSGVDMPRSYKIGDDDKDTNNDDPEWVGLMILEALVLEAMEMKPLVQIEASMEVRNEPDDAFEVGFNDGFEAGFEVGYKAAAETMMKALDPKRCTYS
ncbi:hypothetical protein Pyn_01212 [Prunus yedoensis var. nudiflora]|uniref:Uncharacterized protein n=1 Tax=Prunus yedoensis var. nudiflora TaxID=2094558 RepID=A0A314ZGA3_PRUYE|nr:hypothetical protein Pyn_01212 [Prunus yedoensis var. nudiflora]